MPLLELQQRLFQLLAAFGGVGDVAAFEQIERGQSGPAADRVAAERAGVAAAAASP